MEAKVIRCGNHVSNNVTDGYIYSFNTSRGLTFNSHIHKCYEFIHVLRGNLLYTVEGNEYMLFEGDFIMTNPEELHSFSFPAECEYQREFLHVYPGFVKDYPELTAALDARKMGTFNRFPEKLVKKYEIDKIFRRFEQYCTEREPEVDFLALGLTIELLAKINQVLRKESPQRQSISSSKKTTAVCEYIDIHYKENISVDTIASALFISPSHMSRIFKREMGMTVKSYLNMRRVTHAKNLIMDTQPVTTAFLDCGFSDYSTFYRAFLKYTGMSPDEFKHTHNNLTERSRIS